MHTSCERIDTREQTANCISHTDGPYSSLSSRPGATCRCTDQPIGRGAHRSVRFPVGRRRGRCSVSSIVHTSHPPAATTGPWIRDRPAMDVCTSLLKLTGAVALSRPGEQKGMCVAAASNCRDSHHRGRESHHTAGDSATHPGAFHTRSTGIGKMRGCETGNHGHACHTKRNNVFFALDQQHTAESCERDRESNSRRHAAPARQDRSRTMQAARRCSAHLGRPAQGAPLSATRCRAVTVFKGRVLDPIT
jgi:hypothetical protein